MESSGTKWVDERHAAARGAANAYREALSELAALLEAHANQLASALADTPAPPITELDDFKKRVMATMAFIGANARTLCGDRMAAYDAAGDMRKRRRVDAASPNQKKMSAVVYDAITHDIAAEVYAPIAAQMHAELAQLTSELVHRTRHDKVHRRQEAGLTGLKIAGHLIGNQTGVHPAIYVEFVQFFGELYRMLRPGEDSIDAAVRGLYEGMALVDLAERALRIGMISLYRIPDVAAPGRELASHASSYKDAEAEFEAALAAAQRSGA